MISPVVLTPQLDVSQFNCKAPDALDSSMLKDFLSCPQKFYLAHILGLRPDRDRTALQYGKVWHRAMELLQVEGKSAGLDVIIKSEGEFSLQDAKNRTTARMAEDFMKYLKKWEAVETNWEVLASEEGFKLELANGRMWSGRIDEVRRHRVRKYLLAHDFKSTTFKTANYFDQFEMGIQIPGYVWALEKLRPDEEVKGATIDCYHIQKNKTDFERRTFHVTALKRAAWEENVCRITDRVWFLIENHLEDPGAWIMDAGQRCSDYGGCDFKLIHEIEPKPGDRERILKHDFTELRWDPLVGEVDADGNVIHPV